jgi:hypothetical protein
MGNSSSNPVNKGLLGDLADALLTQSVWEKGHIVEGADKETWRQDDYGNWINRWAHNDQSSAFGWHADHILPKALGGSDDLWNRRPLLCRTNTSLGGTLSHNLSKG